MSCSLFCEQWHFYTLYCLRLLTIDSPFARVRHVTSSSSSDRWQCADAVDPLTACGVKRPFNNPHFLLTVTKAQTVYIVLQQADVRGGGGGSGPIEQLKRLQAEERELAQHAGVDGDGNEDDAKFEENEEEEEMDDPDGDGVAGTKSAFQFIMFYVFDNDGRRVADVPRAKSQLVAAANRSRFLNDREVRYARWWYQMQAIVAPRIGRITFILTGKPKFWSSIKYFNKKLVSQSPHISYVCYSFFTCSSAVPRELSAEVALPHANSPFTVLCTTRDARAETRFTLSVFANEAVRLERMPPPTEAVGARLRYARVSVCVCVCARARAGW